MGSERNIMTEGEILCETQTHKNAFITFEAEAVMECGDCGGLRKVATYQNPS